uniref:Uncharacterized protein n=1 Tax=Siphoviridae sp. ctZHD14 TaxID=2827891 RepID=A0A8S5SXF4_9CAUD|nr:MAG TPA: hypothetical protein [Siphoviridae sp. ctZHD14]
MINGLYLSTDLACTTPFSKRISTSVSQCRLRQLVSTSLSLELAK